MQIIAEIMTINKKKGYNVTKETKNKLFIVGSIILVVVTVPFIKAHVVIMCGIMQILVQKTINRKSKNKLATKDILKATGGILMLKLFGLLGIAILYAGYKILTKAWQTIKYD